MGSLGSIFIKLRECSLTALLGTQRYCWGCGKTVSASLIKLFQCLKTCFVKTLIAVTSSGLGSCPILLMLAAFCWPSRCLISIFVSRSKMAKNVYQSINHFKLQHKSVFFISPWYFSINWSIQSHLCKELQTYFCNWMTSSISTNTWAVVLLVKVSMNEAIFCLWILFLSRLSAPLSSLQLQRGGGRPITISW